MDGAGEALCREWGNRGTQRSMAGSEGGSAAWLLCLPLPLPLPLTPRPVLNGARQ